MRTEEERCFEFYKNLCKWIEYVYVTWLTNLKIMISTVEKPGENVTAYNFDWLWHIMENDWCWCKCDRMSILNAPRDSIIMAKEGICAIHYVYFKMHLSLRKFFDGSNFSVRKRDILEWRRISFTFINEILYYWNKW